MGHADHIETLKRRKSACITLATSLNDAKNLILVEFDDSKVVKDIQLMLSDILDYVYRQLSIADADIKILQTREKQ